MPRTPPRAHPARPLMVSGGTHGLKDEEQEQVASLLVAADLGRHSSRRSRIDQGCDNKKGPAMPGLFVPARRRAYRFASVVWIKNFLRIASM